MNKELAKRKKAIKDITEFGRRKKGEIKELVSKLERKWGIELWWDSKVPENNKNKWFKRFSLFGASDRKEMISEIRRYLELYKELESVQVIQDDEKAFLRKIQDLDKTLSDMVNLAKNEQYNTGSSTVYNLHTDIIAREEQIVDKIGRVKLSILEHQVTSLTNKLDEALQLNEESRKEVETMNEECAIMRNSLQKMSKENKEMEKQNKALKELALRSPVKELVLGMPVKHETAKAAIMMMPNSSLTEIRQISLGQSLNFENNVWYK